jgi:putative endonuclease
MYNVYVVWSERLRKRYVGSAEDIAERLKDHNQGGSTFAKRGIPWILIHVEEFQSKKETRKRENFLRTGAGRAWLDQQFPQYRKGAGVVELARLESV